MPEYQLRSLQFRREREQGWRTLSGLVERAESGGLGALNSSELSSLPGLYRSALSSLSVARSISLDLGVVEYLEGLCARSYLIMYRPRRDFWRATAEFLGRGYPRAVRELKWPLLIATLVLFAGVAAAYFEVRNDESRYYQYMPAEMASGRTPNATTESLRDTLYAGDESRNDELANFAVALFRNNAGIGLLSFALGGLAGIPVFLLVFKNGAVFGAFLALFVSRGLGVELMGWILPHGITEFLAILLCAAAGLHIGNAMVFPGLLRRSDALRLAARRAGRVALGTILLFVIAGLIEGLFRQKVQSDAVRYSVAAISAAWWLMYFGFVGRYEPCR